MSISRTWRRSSARPRRFAKRCANANFKFDKHGIRGASIYSHPDSNELTEITKLIEAKKIKPIVTRVVPLTEAVKAEEQAETHHTRGKIVIKIADEPKA